MKQDLFKFRTPVVCQNGHKAFIYWELYQGGSQINVIKTEGVPADQSCECPKFDFGEGWRRAGKDQQCTGIKTWLENKLIYEGDILQNGRYTWEVRRYANGGFNIKVDDDGTIQKTQTKIIGSIYLKGNHGNSK